jgi:hypothetical protein
MRRYVTPILLGMALLVCGCFETKETYYLNPDGTGKVDIDASFQSMNMRLDGGQQNSEQQMKEAVREILVESSGIDVWKTVSHKRLDDGRISFKGTAYFRDLAKVEFKNLGKSKMSFVKRKDGKLELTIDPQEKKEKKPAGEEAEKLTDEQVTAKVKAERAKYQQARNFMSGFLSSMRTEKIFHLPGAVAEVNNLRKDETDALHFVLEGKKMLEVMDKIMADDEWMKQEILEGRDVAKEGPSFDDRVNEMVFGAKGPVRAVAAAGGRPLFDYAAEVKAAGPAYKKLLNSLGGAPPVPVTPAVGGGLKGVGVAGVRLVRLEDNERGLRAFNWTRGYTLSLVAEFPGTVVRAENGMVEKAVADNGEDLLPEDRWRRKTGFMNLSKDKTAVIFDVNMKVPGEGVKGIKELSGSFEYLVAEGSEETDLGISEFKKGAKGNRLGASITELEDSKWEEGSQQITVRFGLARHAVKSVVFYGADGTKLKTTTAGSSSSRNTCSLSYALKGAFPARGRIVAEIQKGLKRFKVPFRLENISLLGRAMK